MNYEVLGNFCIAPNILATVLCTLCFLFYLSTKRPKNFPPGPIGLPILGYTPFLGRNVGETLRKLKKKYGPLMSVQMGRKHYIVLNDYETITECLVKRGDLFSGREHNAILELCELGDGLAFTDYGEDWKKMSKFGMMTLRGFGVGSKSMEQNIVEEAPNLVELLISDRNVPLKTKLTYAVSNLICRVVFGERFSYDDDRFQTLVRILNRMLGNTTHSKVIAFLNLVPQLRYLPVFKNYLKDILEDLEEYDGLMRKLIEEHKREFDENNIRDFIDAFLREMKLRGPEDSGFTEKVLRGFVKDLFQGGSSSSAATLRWMVLALAHYPEIQEKVEKEVLNAIGESGVPSMKHRQQMPYTCAFMHEIMRHRTLTPVAIPHKTNGDCVIRGYRIPKDTMVIPNRWSVHFDPELFENPDEFRPERFLDDDGEFATDPHLIPFSVGPRRCIGEQLARMELFLFLVSIVQKVKILPDPQRPLPLFEDAECGFTFEGPDFDVIFQPR